MNLTTRYMGLDLKTPLVSSASPVNADLDNIRRLEDAGIGAIVLPSLFEEEIQAGTSRLEDQANRQITRGLAAIADKGALFRSLGDTWADTTTAHGRLILTVLGGLAEFEAYLIRARTSEGRKRAVANGVKLGRKPTLTPHQRQEAKRRIKAGKETRGEIARSYNVSRWTIQRLD
jgi:Resolvase, N terminal domain/Helix-turn-helix domain of resolvase